MMMNTRTQAAIRQLVLSSSRQIPLIAGQQPPQAQSGGGSPGCPTAKTTTTTRRPRTMAFPAGGAAEPNPKIRVSVGQAAAANPKRRRPPWRHFFATSSMSQMESLSQQQQESDGVAGGGPGGDGQPKGLAHRLRVVLPHVLLFMATLLYGLLGALIFQRLEQSFEVQHLREHAEAVAEAQREFMDLKWTQMQQQKQQQMIGNDSENALLVEKLEMAVDNLIRLHMDAFEQGIRADELAKAIEHFNVEYLSTNGSQGGEGNKNVLSNAGLDSDGKMEEEEAEEATGGNRTSKWHFQSSLFFTATLLTSIGYGNLVPISPVGRLFCIGYGSLGIPLTLVTIADLAKYLGDLILRIGHWLERRLFKKRRRGAGQQNRHQSAEDEEAEGSNEEAEGILRQPGPYTRAFVLFLLFSYMFSTAVLISRVQPGWGLLGSLYFTLITLVTIGFGDFCPNLEDASSPATSAAFGWILFIFVGLILSTLTVDIIGSSYIERIHTLGRGLHLGSLITMLKLGRGDAGPDSARLLQQLQAGAYIPADLNLIPYIDQLLSQRPSTETVLSLQLQQQQQSADNGNGPPKASATGASVSFLHRPKVPPGTTTTATTASSLSASNIRRGSSKRRRK